MNEQDFQWVKPVEYGDKTCIYFKNTITKLMLIAWVQSTTVQLCRRMEDEIGKVRMD